MKRVVSIQDISCLGKCSLTVALPIISAMGVETCVVPTAVLSTHTGGFTGFTYRDLTGDILPMARHWKSLGCRFQALYTGFLGSEAQIGLVEQIFDWFREENTLVMVDPVMGDGGKLYKTYTPEMASGMARLCRRADIVVPNMTEACHLLGPPLQSRPLHPRGDCGNPPGPVRHGAQDGGAHRRVAAGGRPGHRLLRQPGGGERLL